MRSTVMAEGTTPASLDRYGEPLPGVYDELRSPEGLRPHWEEFIHAFEGLGQAEWSRRWESARRMLREHGVTYNPSDLERPWELDSIPFILSLDDWRGIEAGLAQRARLLNAIIADLYGPQNLLKEGLIPPGLVYSNPNYWRPLHNLRVPHDLYLHLYAAELAHSPDGRWWVMADRTQTASGTGYALENRTVLANSLPEVFRSCGVQRITGYFAEERALLAGLSPRNTDNPRIVLLTPGPRTQTYFEHAYLARHLGFTLVEGSDLTVRDDCVFLKTLEGLRQIDVILRRIDDALCDPLELQGNSSQGVVGLVQAARSGKVAIANPLGSSLVEAPAFINFLPDLCRHLLGEPLALPSVATWWCGQPEALDHVLGRLEDLVVKPAFDVRGGEPIFVRELSAEKKSALIKQIRARPGDYIAQEIVDLSGTPIASGGRLESRPVLLRAFGIADNSGRYSMLPGGLTRVMAAPNTGGPGLMHHADGSKDTWVLGESRAAEHTLAAGSEQSVAIIRSSTDLPSRIADDLFWMGRYAERAEATVRLVRAVLERLGTESAGFDQSGMTSLLQILDSLGLMTMTFGIRRKESRARALELELFSVIYKQQRPGSLRDTLNRMHRIAAQVRDRLSTDTWRILNQLHQAIIRPDAARRQDGEAQVLLNSLITSLAAFNGMEMENMTRGHGWRFLDMGRRLERSLQMIGLLRAALPEIGPDKSPAVLEALLDIADSSMTYRSRYFTTLALGPTMDLLVADESNPRSLAFQLYQIRQHVRRMPRDPRAPSPTREENLADELSKMIDLKDLQSHCQLHMAGEHEPLDQLLGTLFEDLLGLASALTHYYFSHAERRRSIDSQPDDDSNATGRDALPRV